MILSYDLLRYEALSRYFPYTVIIDNGMLVFQKAQRIPDHFAGKVPTQQQLIAEITSLPSKYQTTSTSTKLSCQNGLSAKFDQFQSIEYQWLYIDLRAIFLSILPVQKIWSLISSWNPGLQLVIWPSYLMFLRSKLNPERLNDLIKSCKVMEKQGSLGHRSSVLSTK